ncbi:MAG: CotH kinase family protein [Defluviitaleaceae bacterium]|nr:CotH kinase family protein [Defluviitaleaceae bacterium]
MKKVMICACVSVIVVILAIAIFLFVREARYSPSGTTEPDTPDTGFQAPSFDPPVFNSGFQIPNAEFIPLPVDPRHFRSLHLTTYQCPFDIERTLWHDAYLTLEGAFEEEGVRLRGRGNTTWWLGEDKRPLRLRFNEPVFLLGSDYAARDWILLSNHFDYSLLRNYGALTLSRLLGLDGRMDY